MSESLETVTIKKTEAGYELIGENSISIAVYLNWDPIEQMLRRADFSSEYIRKRKDRVDHQEEIRIVP